MVCSRISYCGPSKPGPYAGGSVEDDFGPEAPYWFLVCAVQLQQVETERDLLRSQKEEASVKAESLQIDLDRARGQVSQVCAWLAFFWWIKSWIVGGNKGVSYRIISISWWWVDPVKTNEVFRFCESSFYDTFLTWNRWLIRWSRAAWWPQVTWNL